jgi:hypothetical protein
MSQEWLDIQSFFADHEVLRAITDLSLAMKFELAGIKDSDRAQRSEKAKMILERFFAKLEEASDDSKHGRLLSLDHRSLELFDALQKARRDTANYRSVMMRSGFGTGTQLLNASDRRSREALVESLDELRRVISQHQQGTMSAIIEDL